MEAGHRGLLIMPRRCSVWFGREHRWSRHPNHHDGISLSGRYGLVWLRVFDGIDRLSAILWEHVQVFSCKDGLCRFDHHIWREVSHYDFLFDAYKD